MSFIKGMRLTFVKEMGRRTVEWKQGSFMGLGGDRSETYSLCEYRLDNGGRLQVYIGTGYRPDKSFTIDNRFRFGMNDGTFFLVLDRHDNEPYQHRFVQSPTQKAAYAVNYCLKMKGVDFTWIFGDYLRTV